MIVKYKALKIKAKHKKKENDELLDNEDYLLDESNYLKKRKRKINDTNIIKLINHLKKENKQEKSKDCRLFIRKKKNKCFKQKKQMKFQRINKFVLLWNKWH